MALRKLTQRTYLGEGHVHVLVNDVTGAELVVPCTQQEYEQLAQVDGEKYRPKIAGHTWQFSMGGTVKVDTPTTLLGDDEYCIKGTDVVINLSGVDFDNKYQTQPKTVVDSSGNLDKSKVSILRTGIRTIN